MFGICPFPPTQNAWNILQSHDVLQRPVPVGLPEAKVFKTFLPEVDLSCGYYVAFFIIGNIPYVQQTHPSEWYSHPIDISVLHLELNHKKRKILVCQPKTAFSHKYKRCPEGSELTFNYAMTIPDRLWACQTFSVICGEPLSWLHTYTRNVIQVIAALPTESYQLLGDMGKMR